MTIPNSSKLPNKANSKRKPATPRKSSSSKNPIIPSATGWEIENNPNGEGERLILFVNKKPIVFFDLDQVKLEDLMDALNDKLFTIGATDVDAWYLRNSETDLYKGVLSFSANHAIVGSLGLDDETLKSLVPALLKYYDPRKTWSQRFWNWIISHKPTAIVLLVVIITLITAAFIFKGGN